MKCLKCGFENPDGNVFCNNCGEKLEPVPVEKPKRFCPNCGTPAGAENVFCEKCGTRLDAEVVPVPKPEEPVIQPQVENVETVKEEELVVPNVEEILQQEMQEKMQQEVQEVQSTQVYTQIPPAKQSEPKPEGTKKTGLIVALVIGGVVIVALIAVIAFLLLGKRTAKSSIETALDQYQQEIETETETETETEEAQGETAAQDAESNSIGNAEILEQAQQNEVVPEQNTDYIFPNSASAYLTEADLDGISPENLRIAINEIYARRGYIFTKEDMISYFGGKSWYTGTIASDAFSESVFNDFERENLDLMKAYKEKMNFSW